MDAREFTNLQELLVWAFDPIIRPLLAIFLGATVLTAFLDLFSKVARYLTRAGGNR